MTSLASLTAPFYTTFLPDTLREIITKSIGGTEVLTNDSIMREVYFALYNKHGIRRRIISSDAVLLNYRKSHAKYDRDDELTNIFRCVTLNPNTMGFTSFGIPRAAVFNDKVRDEMIATGPAFNSVYKCQLYEYGTMIIFNKNRTYTYTMHNIDDNSDEQITIDASVSTRSKIEADGRYNSEQSHRYYFEYNNSTDSTNPLDLSKLNASLNNVTFVFNMRNVMEHFGGINGNTLMACYSMPTKTEEMAANWTAILDKVRTGDVNGLDELCVNHWMLADIIEHPVEQIVKIMVADGVGTPRVMSNLEFTTYKDVEDFVDKQDVTQAGVMIWALGGIRTKLRNPRFTYVRNLCYGMPINPSPLNQRSLFKIYWQLLLNNKIPEFLKYYETPDAKYNFIFQFFQNRLMQFTNLLFHTYQGVHVQKRIPGEKIYKFLKPLCYELHKNYLETKDPITHDKVIEYIKYLEFPALYGRLFTPLM